jgi:hypothetical protein
LLEKQPNFFLCPNKTKKFKLKKGHFQNRWKNLSDVLILPKKRQIFQWINYASKTKAKHCILHRQIQNTHHQTPFAENGAEKRRFRLGSIPKNLCFFVCCVFLILIFWDKVYHPRRKNTRLNVSFTVSGGGGDGRCMFSVTPFSLYCTLPSIRLVQPDIVSCFMISVLVQIKFLKSIVVVCFLSKNSQNILSKVMCYNRQF